MKSRKTGFFALLILALLTGVVGYYFHIQSGVISDFPAPGAGEQEASAPVMPAVEITPEMQICETDADCAVVDPTCSDCCKYQPINTASLDLFHGKLAEMCGGGAHAVCDCYNPMSLPVCQEKRCGIARKELTPGLQ